MPSLEHVRPIENHVDYTQLDKPTVIRRQAPVQPAAPAASPATPTPAQPAASRPSIPTESLHDIDYLDIPAFLRRKEEEVS